MLLKTKPGFPKFRRAQLTALPKIRFVSHVALKCYRSTTRAYYLSDNLLGSGFIRCTVDYNRCTLFPEAACYRSTDSI